MIRRPPRSTLFPLHDALPIFTQAAGASKRLKYFAPHHMEAEESHEVFEEQMEAMLNAIEMSPALEAEALALVDRSEEHTSELQSRQYLVCRLLLEKKRESPAR